MMPVADKIRVSCCNPDEVRLRVEIELPLPQWREILERTKDVKYYGPLNDILHAIREATGNFQTSALADVKRSAVASPKAAATRERSKLSTSDCRMSRNREAPKALRSAVSCCRETARVSCRFAAFDTG